MRRGRRHLRIIRPWAPDIGGISWGIQHRNTTLTWDEGKRKLMDRKTNWQTDRSRVGKWMDVCIQMDGWIGRKEGNVLFNDTLNTFYLWLYGVRYMVKNHSDSEKGNQLPPRRLLFTINSKGSFICTIPQTGLHIPRPLLNQSCLNEK